LRLTELIVRGLRKPPHVMVRRVRYEMLARAERFLARRRRRRFNGARLLTLCD
jgi:hypothetical protein